MNNIIFIIGPDGVGKTTQIETLVEKLRKKGVDWEYKWLRFHHLLSLPLLAFARLMGLSEVKTLESGRKIGYHYFYKSKIVSYLYQVFLLLDTVIYTIIKVYIPTKFFNKNIIYDRFIYDTLVDLMISTGNYDIYESNIGNLFLRLIPRNSNAILLIADEETLRKRRDDVLHDKTLSLKIKLYTEISKKFNVTVIDASLPIEKVQKKLMDKIS